MINFELLPKKILNQGGPPGRMPGPGNSLNGQGMVNHQNSQGGNTGMNYANAVKVRNSILHEVRTHFSESLNEVGNP